MNANESICDFRYSFQGANYIIKAIEEGTGILVSLYVEKYMCVYQLHITANSDNEQLNRIIEMRGGLQGLAVFLEECAGLGNLVIKENEEKSYVLFLKQKIGKHKFIEAELHLKEQGEYNTEINFKSEKASINELFSKIQSADVQLLFEALQQMQAEIRDEFKAEVSSLRRELKDNNTRVAEDLSTMKKDIDLVTVQSFYLEYRQAKKDFNDGNKDQSNVFAVALPEKPKVVSFFKKNPQLLKQIEDLYYDKHTTLDFTDMNLGDEVIDLLAECSSESMSKIKGLILRGNRISSKGIANLKLCSYLKNITFLDLSLNQLDNDSVKYLKLCPFLKTLTVFDLSENYLNEDSIPMLKDCPNLNNLKKLNLSLNKFTIGSKDLLKDCGSLSNIAFQNKSLFNIKKNLIYEIFGFCGSKLEKELLKIKSKKFYTLRPILIKDQAHRIAQLVKERQDIFIKKAGAVKQFDTISIFNTRNNVVCVTYGEIGEDLVLFSAAINGHIYMWNIHDESLIGTLKEHTSFINSMIPYKIDNNPVLISGGKDKVIIIWDLKNKTPITTLKGHTDSIMAMQIVVINGREHIASGSADYSISFWNLNVGNQVFSITEGTNSVFSLVKIRHSETEDYLVSGSGGNDYSIKKWDYKNKKCVKSVVGHTNGIRYLIEFKDPSSGKYYMASASYDKTAGIWDPIKLEILYKLESHAETIWCLASLVVDGVTYVATGSGDKKVIVWNISKTEGDRKVKELTHTSHIGGVCTVRVRNMEYVASGGYDNVIKVWKI